MREDGRIVSYLKGAPEVLIDRCALSDDDRESWKEKADAYARERFRVLAVAWATGTVEEELSLELMVPLTAAQILWINLLADGLPALALAFDRTPEVMRQPPRSVDSPLLDRPSARFVIGTGSMKAALALAVLALIPRLGYDLEVARATAFHFMAIGQLLLTYPSGHTGMRPLANPYLHAAVVVGIGVQIAAASLPLTAGLLGNARLPTEFSVFVFAGALLAWALSEAISRVVWRGRPDSETTR